MNMDELKGKRALVTGASSGLGAEFARQLAAAGCDLVLVARRRERLNALREELTGAHGVAVEVHAADLSEPDAPDELFRAVTDGDRGVDVLINNAGLGLYGRFEEIPWESERRMLQLDILALVHLTKLVLPGMRDRGSGHILQIASNGAYQPSPLYASYAAAKSFVLNFGEALSYELRGTGVTCTVLSPGITATEFLEVSGQRPTLYQRLFLMRAETVVRIGLRRMLRGRSSTIAGWRNAVMAWSLRFVPRRMATMMAYRLMRSN